VLVGGNYHKQYWISADTPNFTNYVSIIEGVGTTFGLFGYFFEPLRPPFEVGSMLLCQARNGIQIYPDNGGTSSCVPITVDVTEELKAPLIDIYPNPTTEMLNIRSTVSIRALQISNVIGEIIYISENKSNLADIDLSEFPAAIYFLKIIDEKGNAEIKKIVKQ
jgi:hypothetical protein